MQGAASQQNAAAASGAATLLSWQEQHRHPRHGLRDHSIPLVRHMRWKAEIRPLLGKADAFGGRIPILACRPKQRQHSPARWSDTSSPYAQPPLPESPTAAAREDISDTRLNSWVSAPRHRGCKSQAASSFSSRFCVAGRGPQRAPLVPLATEACHPRQVSWEAACFTAAARWHREDKKYISHLAAQAFTLHRRCPWKLLI